MKIAVMLRTLEEEQGIGIYSRNLATHLLRNDARNEYHFLYVNEQRRGSFGRQSNLKEVVLPLRNKFWWDQVQVARYANQNNIDIVLSTKYAVPLLTRAKTMMIFHATEWFVYPQFYSRADVLYNRIFLPLYIRKCAAVSSVSQFTIDDMRNFVRFDVRRAHAIHTGIDPVFKPVTDTRVLESVRARFNLPEHFILFVGKNYPGKNIPNIMRAFKLIRKESPHPVKLVAVGKLNLDPFRGYVEDSVLADIHCTGWLDQADLPALYSLADALLFPSFYESFGIPIPEAMACGCPVVTSKTGACPEIAGRGAVLVDPLRPREIADGVLKVLRDQDFREALIEQGLEEAKRFDWDDAARKTIQVFESIAGTAAEIQPSPQRIRDLTLTS